MEDEQGDVCPSETLVENTGSKNRVEESFEEEDAGEIMVEVVGSDVFVDGVSGHKDGDLESGEVGDLEGPVCENKEEPGTRTVSEAMDVSTEGDGNKMGESEFGLSESRDARNDVAKEEVGVNFSESVVVESGAVSALPSRGVSDDEVRKPGIEATTVSSSVATATVTVQTDEVTTTTHVLVSEEKTVTDEAVDKDSAEFVAPESLNPPVEAVADEKVEVAEKEEVLPLNNNTANDDHLRADTVVSHEAANEAHDGQIAPSEGLVDPDIEDSEKVKVDGVDSVVGEVGPDNASAGGETLATSSPKDGSFKDSAVSAKTDGDSVVAAKSVDEKEASAAESKDHILESDAIVSTVQDENQGSLNELDGVKLEANNQIDAASNAVPESIHENTLVSERGETTGVEFYVVPDFKEGASDVDLLDASCVDNDECLKTDGDVGTGMVHQNHVLPTEPNEMTGEGDTAELNEGKGLNIEIPADTEEKQRNTTSPSCSRDEEMVEADSGMHVNEPAIAPTVGEVVDDQKVVEGGRSHDKGEEIDSDIPKQSLECQRNAEISALNASTENRDLTATDVSAKVETADVGVTEDAACKNPVVDSEFGSENVAEESCLPQNTEQEISVQIADTSNDGVGKLTRINVIPNEATSVTAVADSTLVSISPEITEKAELHVSSTNVSSLDGGDIEEDSVCRVATSGGEVNKSKEADDNYSKNGGSYIEEGHTSETSNHVVDKLESINVMPNEVTSVSAVSDSTQVSISPEVTEKAELHVSTTNISLTAGGVTEGNSVCEVATSSGYVDKPREVDDNSTKADGFSIEEGHISETKPMDVEEESGFDITHHDKNEVDSELGMTEGPASENDRPMMSNEETVKSTSSLRMNQSDYLSPPENEGCFALSDLVWGKVRSHPWWPGQIFDSADASEKAVKYYKKDSYLVAYFGDRTFAWNDASLLKPFRPHFSQIEKQSNSEAFQNAADCALEEVSRRVELGLACSCIPKDAYSKIETQVVENTGIREESSRRYGVDQSSRAASFEPDKLLEYITELAPRASSGADRLDLVIAQSQLSAFCRFKGYRSPSEIPSSGELLENDADTEQISDKMVASHKRKHTPKDDSESRKERSMSELIGDGEYSPDAESVRKRRAFDPLADGSDKRESANATKISTSTSQTPKPSFKIGECIRKVASQLTRSTSLVKGSNDEAIIDGSPNIYEHSGSFSVNEMLSQLQLAAQDPRKGHNFQKNIHTFFLGFRSSIALNRRGRKKRAEPTIGGSGEEFEFDDVNDSYWTDRIVQNYSEEQLLHNSENGAGSPQVVPYSAEKSVKPGRKPNSRKRYSTGSFPTEATELDESVKRKKLESSPAELILNFAERNSVPSEINLNKMFRRFGPLMESETEVDHESGRAKVIFKRGADAEVARSSSEKFNIFGPALVNYQIGYSPLISVKILPLAFPQGPEDATLML